MKNNIPKIIHYCWFGRGKKPEIVEKCIESWHNFLPDYEIIEWNEDNFDVSKNNFLKKAYKEKKWAFVADFARLEILYNYGGIYLDTDMEILKNLDEFLCYRGFLGFEDENFVNGGIMGFEKSHPFLKECLVHYDEKNFQKYILIPEIITEELEKLGLQKNQNQILENGGIWVAQSQYFYPWQFRTPFHHALITEKSYTIHHWATSWYPWYLQLAKKLHLLPLLAFL